MKKLIHSVFAVFFIVGIIGALQAIAAVPASAGSVPPPDSCASDDANGGYDYSDPDCWGTAGNPPSGCVAADHTVNNTTACLDWAAKVPADQVGASECDAPKIQGPLGLCCSPTDQTCLDGSIQTPQGDPRAVAMAKTVCDELRQLPGVKPESIPYACTVLHPTLEAGTAACEIAFSSFSITPTVNNIWNDCTEFQLLAGGEATPHNAPLDGDKALALKACQILLANKNLVDPAQIPSACSGGDPSPQDGVIACKLLALSNNPDVLGDTKNACLDMVRRNPANGASPVEAQPPQHVEFDSKNLKKLVQGLSYFALALCIGGVFFSMTLWVVGAKGNNEGTQHTGKRGLIVCLAAAFILGALPQLFYFYDGLAHQVDDNHVTDAN